jgi:hypothetical protein
VSWSGYPTRWGAQERGRELFREEVRSRVRFLGIVRVLVSLGERSTCVECLLSFPRLDLGDLLVSGSFFSLGQGKRWSKSELIG